MYRKITKKNVAIIISVMLIGSVFSSCNVEATVESITETIPITIPLIIETSMAENNIEETTTGETYLDIDFSIDEDGYLFASYDDLTVHLKVPETDVTNLPVYSVDFNYRPSRAVMDDSEYQQLSWSWFSISLNGYINQDAEAVEVNNRFINSYNTIDIDAFDEEILCQITNLFPSKELSDYAVSYLFELETPYDNYDMLDIDFKEVQMQNDFYEYTFREKLDSIPIGILNAGRSNDYRVDYEINNEDYFGSLVAPDESVVFTDGINVYRYNYYPISNYVIAQENQSITSFEDCIDAAVGFAINESRRQRKSSTRIYAAELIYMIYYDFPDYCCTGAESANYYLIPVWAFYYQMGDVSQQPSRGAVFIDAYTGDAF